LCAEVVNAVLIAELVGKVALPEMFVPVPTWTVRAVHSIGRRNTT
jgi:hypothetical protein